MKKGKYNNQLHSARPHTERWLILRILNEKHGKFWLNPPSNRELAARLTELYPDLRGTLNLVDKTLKSARLRNELHAILAMPTVEKRVVKSKPKIDKVSKFGRALGFYDTEEWQRVRYEVLRRSEGCCMLCKRQAYKSNPLHVDHIKPRSKYPELALTISNLQVLCRQCNLGKSNRYEDDWRPVDEPEDTDWYRTHEREVTR